MHIIDALQKLLEARKERDRCFESCEHDAGYFCYRHTEAVDKAEFDFDEALNDRIQSAIKENTHTP